MTTFIPNIERLSARVIRILGCNPGTFRLQGTNSYLVGSGSRRILIDTSDKGQVTYLQNVRKVLDEQNAKIQEIILTHWHEDHVGAVKELCKDVFKERVKVSKMKRRHTSDVDLSPETEYTFLNGNETISTEGANLRIIVTPGHSDDHISLYLEEENAIFSGDCVLGEGTTVFVDLYDYMTSLEKLRGLNASIIYPGHGPVVLNAMAKLTEYIGHRQRREQQIISLLRTQKKWLKVMDLVKVIYAEVSLDLHKAAMGVVLHHLGKLLKEGKVEIDGSVDDFVTTLHKVSAEGATTTTNAIVTLVDTRWRWKQSLDKSYGHEEKSNL